MLYTIILKWFVLVVKCALTIQWIWWFLIMNFEPWVLLMTTVPLFGDESCAADGRVSIYLPNSP